MIYNYPTNTMGDDLCHDKQNEPVTGSQPIALTEFNNYFVSSFTCTSNHVYSNLEGTMPGSF